MGRFIKTLGYVLFYAGMLVIAAGSVLTIYYQGFGKYLELMSPFNLINYGVMFATVAPGIILITLGERLIERRRQRQSE